LLWHFAVQRVRGRRASGVRCADTETIRNLWSQTVENEPSLENPYLMLVFTSSSPALAARWGDGGLSLWLPQYARGRL